MIGGWLYVVIALVLLVAISVGVYYYVEDSSSSDIDKVSGVGVEWSGSGSWMISWKAPTQAPNDVCYVWSIEDSNGKIVAGNSDSTCIKDTSVSVPMATLNLGEEYSISVVAYSPTQGSSKAATIGYTVPSLPSLSLAVVPPNWVVTVDASEAFMTTFGAANVIATGTYNCNTCNPPVNGTYPTMGTWTPAVNGDSIVFTYPNFTAITHPGDNWDLSATVMTPLGQIGPTTIEYDVPKQPPSQPTDLSFTWSH